MSADGAATQSRMCSVTQSYLTLCDSTDCSSSVHGILQARKLEWVATPSSRVSSQPWDRTQVSHIAGDFLSSEPPEKPSMGIALKILNYQMTQQSNYLAYALKPVEKDTCSPMFIAALFTKARTWRQPRCLLTDEWIKKLWYIYTRE